MKRIIIGITGASGVIYGIRLVDFLVKCKDVETHVIISKGGYEVLNEEVSVQDKQLIFRNTNCTIYDNEKINQTIASGSFYFDAFVVIPCSINTIGAIHSNISNSLITRIASVAKKERRDIIIVPRETPLATSVLRQLYELSLEGAIIVPPMPAFYNNPKNLDDIINFTTGKILNLLKIEQSLLPEYKPFKLNSI